MKRFFSYILVGIIIASCSTSKKYVTTHTQEAENLSTKLGIELQKGYNKDLIKSIISWLGTPYKYGGSDKSGTDCSGFIMQVYQEVYNLKTPRSANGIYEASKIIKKENLDQGQFVFFKINTTKVGHVGIFIQESYFAHASSSKGVMISSLDENYWSKYFVGGGKLKEN